MADLLQQDKFYQAYYFYNYFFAYLDLLAINFFWRTVSKKVFYI
ncbi:MAG: hypothetical protein JWR61_4885 [Ferruginibacter sp.]|nr:hypothetical protein [Ferruginibacter sp.]